MIAWVFALPWVRKAAAIAAAAVVGIVGIVVFIWSQRRVGREQERNAQREAALENVRVRNEVERDNRRPNADVGRQLDEWMRD